MLIPVAPAKDESSYINGEHRKIKSALIARGFSPCADHSKIRKKSAENPRFFSNWYLTHSSRKDIGLYHATLLHGPGSQDARAPAAKLAAIDPRKADSVPPAPASGQTANPTLDT